MSLLGRIAYHAWFRPKAELRDLWLDGGPFERRRTEAGRREMIAAARRLEPPGGDGPPLVVHVLTGARYWHQTAFCLVSLARAAGRPVHPVVHGDGSLAPDERALLAGLFPDGRFEPDGEREARIERALPAARYPALRARRADFALLRKLTDVHAGRSGWSLFLDSDLLFFRRPDVLLAWHDAPTRPLRGEDLDNAYGYPLDALAALAGRPVPERVNTGTLGLRSEEVDWDLLERSCRTLEARFGPHYYEEQALVAVLLAGRDCVVPPPEDHVLLPRPPEALACRAVMHHYVAHSKRWYYQHNWRRFVRPAAGT